MARINLGKVVPEKGIDYFTDAEVEEIKNEIKQEIDAQGMARDIELLKTDSGHSIELTLDPQTYQIVLVLKNAAGTALSTQTIDLPNENAVTNLAYNNGILTVTKQSGATSQINLTGLIEGLVTESDFNTFKEALQTTLEAINEKDAEQDEAIAENYKVINKLNEKLENQQKVIDQLPQVEGQGTEVTLENTIEAPFTKFDVEGNSTQDGTPNPDNEVPILSAGDNGSINEKISNGNIFDDIMEQGDIPSYNGQNQNNTLCIRSKNYIPLQPSTMYFFERFGLITDSVGLRFYDKDKNYLSSETTSIGYNVKSKAFTTGNNVHYMRFTDWTNNLTNTYMLSKGNKSVPYVPHKEQDYSIFVQQPFRSIGDVRDLFFKNTVDSPYYDENLTLNGWYERHYIGEVIFDGSEDEGWRFNATSTTPSNRTVIITNNNLNSKYNVNADYVSNMFIKNSTSSNKFVLSAGLYLSLDDALTGITPNDDNNVRLTKMLTYLSTHNAVVQYELAEPLDLPCTEEQIQQLENKPSTYKDFTIIQSQDETPAYLEVSGIYDLNKLINN